MFPLLFFQSSQWNPNWSTILMTSVVIVGGILVNALVVGVAIGEHRRKVEEMARDLAEMQPIVSKMKSIIEIATGTPLNGGTDYRKLFGGD